MSYDYEVIFLAKTKLPMKSENPEAWDFFCDPLVPSSCGDQIHQTNRHHDQDRQEEDHQEGLPAETMDQLAAKSAVDSWDNVIIPKSIT